jgi:hypothetical protein
MDDLAAPPFAETIEAIDQQSAAQTDAETQPIDPCAPRPFQDLPAWVWRAFFASWLLLFLTFAVIFAVSGDVWFVLGVVAAFAAVFFCTPLVLLRLTRRGKAHDCGSHVDLLYGRCTNIEAAIQIVLLPIALSVGLIAIGAMIPE